MSLFSLACSFNTLGLAHAQDTNPAINNPDKLAWSLFVELNQEVPGTGGKVTWETWALARDVFANPNVPPTWPAPNATPRSLLEAEPLLQQLILKQATVPKDGDLRPLFDPARPAANETRMNREAFDFIVGESLYFIEGQEAALVKGAPISFPLPAKEIKARWEPIEAAQISQYHTAQFVNPNTNQTELWGLKALHITTKDVPNWFWATFEHRNNTAIEHVLQNRDSHGLPNSLRGTKWENYVLRGTQVDFTDSTGVPTLLANSVIEGGFEASSSCITCHARSTIGPRIGMSPSANRLPVFESFRPIARGSIGVPDSNLFWDFPNDERRYLQLDFVWSLFRARRREAAPVGGGIGLLGNGQPNVRSGMTEIEPFNEVLTNLSPGIRELLSVGSSPSHAVPSAYWKAAQASEGLNESLNQPTANGTKQPSFLNRPSIASNRLAGHADLRPGTVPIVIDGGDKNLLFNVQVDAEHLTSREFDDLQTMLTDSVGDQISVDPQSQSLTLKRPTPELLFKLSEDDSLKLFEQNPLIPGPIEIGPIGISPQNLDARETHLVDDASASHGLSGDGVTIGVWDEGRVRTTHQEFRVDSGPSRVTQADGAASLSVHSTHVSGTIGAEGEVNQSKGMAPKVRILAHDWNSDVAEMRYEALAGVSCSSHSYGYSLGWEWRNGWIWYGSPSDTTEYRFGKYDVASRQFDDVAHSHREMSIFVAAGNERNNNPPPGVIHLVAQTGGTSTVARLGDGRYAGGYDCMGSLAVAKNVITVGAIHDIIGGDPTPDRVAVTDFSSWGPTDDGRIKPDVVGNGFRLYSTTITGDDQYYTTSGTSMATPAASGIGAILVECFHKHGVAKPRSDQMKAVLIHTAMSPNPGPDYRIGWGSIRADLAANLIAGTGGVMLTDSIQAQEVVWTGKSIGNPIRVTLVWIDPPAPSNTGAANDRTKALVNDLDLKLTAPDGTTTHFPWSLNPDSPAVAATTTAENHRDNVERVDVASPTSGTWKIHVTWPLSHGVAQPFTLVVSELTELDQL